MATIGIYFIDTSTFEMATKIWMDSARTILAPDGYYSINGIYRRQLNGSSYIEFSGTGAPSNIYGIFLSGDIQVPEGVQVTFGISGTPNNPSDGGSATVTQGAYPISGAPHYSFTTNGTSGSTVSTSYNFTMSENAYISGLCDIT